MSTQPEPVKSFGIISFTYQPGNEGPAQGFEAEALKVIKQTLENDKELMARHGIEAVCVPYSPQELLDAVFATYLPAAPTLVFSRFGEALGVVLQHLLHFTTQAQQQVADVAEMAMRRLAEIDRPAPVNEAADEVSAIAHELTHECDH